MQTFTRNLTPRDVIADALPHKYSMELVKADMLALLAALGEYGDSAEDNADTAAAASLRSGILETIGIEEI